MVVVRLVPRLFTLMVAFADVAVNLYHTPFVVADVAPPQAPVGAEFVAPCRSPVVTLQVTAGVSVGAFAQVD